MFLEGRVRWAHHGLFLVLYACLLVPSEEISSRNGQTFAPRPKTHIGESDSSSSSQHLRRNRQHPEAWLNDAMLDGQGEAARIRQNSLRESGMFEHAGQTNHDSFEDQISRPSSAINNSNHARSKMSGREAEASIHAMR
jgi:hypothetical protein